MRADRLVAILLLLQARGRVTVRELGRELEASEKTVRRDLDSLSSAGIPLVATRGRGGGWELLGGHRTDLTGLSAAEAEALLLIAGPTGMAAGLGVEPKLRSAVRKLMAALPAPLRERADAARSRLLVDPTGWGQEHASQPPHLAALREAVLSGVQVDVVYASAGKAATERRLHPCGLVAKAGCWYLLAATAGGVRTFRVSRMEHVTLTAEPVVVPRGFDLAAAWSRARAAMPAWSLPVAVELLADARLEAVLQQTLSGWARLEKRGEGGPGGRSRLVAHLPGARIAALELARFTGWVEVLGPDEVRRELARLGAELVELHGTSGAEPTRPSAAETARPSAADPGPPSAAETARPSAADPGPPSAAKPARSSAPSPARAVPARPRVGHHHRPTLGTCRPLS